MNRELQLVRAISLAADGVYEDGKRFGGAAAMSFKGDRGGKSQIKNLESIANSAIKVADVLDFLKKQISKDNAWRQDRFGFELLTYLEETLGQQAATLARSHRPDDSGARQYVHIQLIRQFVTQLAAHYEFTRAEIGR